MNSHAPDGERLRALLALMDDPDPVVHASVRVELLELGRAAVPSLRTIAERGSDDQIRNAARAMLRRIGLEQFRTSMRAHVSSANRGELDLELAAFDIALIAYPDLEVAPYTARLDTMAAELAGRFRPEQSGLERVATLTGFLVNDLGFQACRQENYYDPENSYVNRVLDRRYGIPISLSAIYLFLARRLTLPLFGVAFPSHFLLKYSDGASEFYIDPFGAGAILDRRQIEDTLKSMGIDPIEPFTSPATTRQIVARMIRNLVEIYRRSDQELSAELETATLLLS